VSLLTDLRTFLLADAAISTDVGATRIHAEELTQNSDLPAMTLQQTDNAHEHDMSGSLGVARATMQITSWAATLIAAKSLAELVRQRLQGKQVTMGTTEVRGVLLPGDRDVFSPDPRRFGVEADYDIWYIESIPA